MSIRDQVYERVCYVLLEPQQLTLGLLTDGQFQRTYVSVLNDFLARTRLVKGLAPIQQQFGVHMYVVPEGHAATQAVFSDGVALYDDAVGDWNEDYDSWGSDIGHPMSWAPDRAMENQFRVRPIPDVDGILTVVAPSITSNMTPDLDADVDILPAPFVIYLAYGILAKLFSENGELKDGLRYRYCQTRYDEGIQRAKIIIAEQEESE